MEVKRSIMKRRKKKILREKKEEELSNDKKISPMKRNMKLEI